MGQAAAHALDLCENGSLHQIDLSKLSERLKPNLDEYRHDPWTQDAPPWEHDGLTERNRLDANV